MRDFVALPAVYGRGFDNAHADRSRRLRVVLELAEALLAGGEPAEACRLLTRVRHLPGTAVERYAIGEALLRASNGALGWDLYDLHPSRTEDRIDGLRRWDGHRCHTLVVVAEQGYGDALQFLRFVPDVVHLGDRVIFAVHDELVDVVASSPLLAGCEVITKSALRTRHWGSGARWERLLSLPKHRVEGIPIIPSMAYLNVPHPSRKLDTPEAESSMFTIGLAWRSTPRDGVPDRSIPLSLAVRHLSGTGVRLVSLHRPTDVGAVPAAIIQLDIAGFSDTAAVAAGCDVVVTADTVTAHLAPALGIRTLICLRHRPDWRWGTPRNPTTWYADAELVFQDGRERWESAIVAVARRLDALRRSSR